MPQTEVTEAAGAATMTVNPPSRYPTSMLLREVVDTAVVAALREEQVLRAELPDLRDRRRALKAKLDTLLRSRNATKTDARQKFDVKINDLHTERRRILSALESMREHQGKRASFRNKITDLEYEVRIASHAHSEAESKLLAEQERLRNCSGAGKASEQKQLVQKLKKEVAAKEAEKLQKEDAYAKARIEFNASSPDFAERTARDEQFRNLHMKLNTVLEELELANQQRRAATATDDNAAKIDEARAQQKDADTALEKVESRLAEIRALLFPESQHVTYNPTYHQALIGRGGATLRQLQEDFGVAICIDTLPAGHAFVVGGTTEAQACMVAIAAIVKDEEARNTSTTLLFAEPKLRKELIGPRGSTVDRFQDEYDVRMQSDDSGVTITGRQHDVAEAKEAIRAYLNTFTQREMMVPISVLPSLLGRRGRNIARIANGSGLRSLRIDRERGVVLATGTPDAIERAFALCRSAIGEGEGVLRVVHADNAWVSAVIGPGGSMVRKLEEETNANIQCSGNTISLTGTQEAVKTAYERVAALRRTERIIPVELKRLHFLTSPIVLLTKEEHQSPTVSRGGSSYITPLEAVRRTTRCDQVVSLRAEGSVVLRGTPDAVNTAYSLLKLLLRHNEPFSINIAFLDILRNFMMNRNKDWGNKNLLDYIPSLFVSPVRIDVDWAARRLTVSSCSEREARAATNKIVSCLREYSATHVRLISNFPEHAIGRLLGARGATIRQLREATNTEIVLVRDRAQVQVLNADGDVEKLESAVHAIRVAVFGEEGEDEEDGGNYSHSSGEAFAAQTPTRRAVIS